MKIKKQKDTKNYLEVTKLKNKINHQGKKWNSRIVLKKIIRNSYKKNKLILIAQQRFKSERYNVLMKKLIRWKNAINWFDRNVCIWKDQLK